jgi:hypothetical protein
VIRRTAVGAGANPSGELKVSVYDIDGGSTTKLETVLKNLSQINLLTQKLSFLDGNIFFHLVQR